MEDVVAKNIMFSIIVPCYNSEAYLKDAFESVLSQTYSNWELVAINDGSSDNTLEMLNSYAEKDSRIKVHSKVNGGYATAISKGLDFICGKYFLMLGSDDKLYPTLLEEMSKRICVSEPDIICFRTVQIRDSEILGFADNVTREVFEKDITIKEIEEKYGDMYEILFARDTSKCYKTDLLQGQRMLGKKGLDADGIFSATFCHKIHSVLFLPVEGYRWTLRSESVSGRACSVLENTDRLENWNLFFGFLLTLSPDEICKREYVYWDYVKYICSCYLPQVKIYDFKKLNLVRQLNKKYLKLSKKIGVSLPISTSFGMHFVVIPQFFDRLKRRFFDMFEKNKT